MSPNTTNAKVNVFMDQETTTDPGGTVVTVYEVQLRRTKGFFQVDNPGTDMGWAGLETRNDTGYPAIAFHRSGMYAPQLRAIAADEFQAVDQPGGTLVKFRAILNADDLGIGTISDARLPARLRGDHNTDVPGADWNNATKTGWYAQSACANAPEGSTSWHLGMVMSHIDGWVTQTVHRFTDDNSANTLTFRRERNDGGWQPWYQTMETITELDGRYVTKHNGGGGEVISNAPATTGAVSFQGANGSMFRISPTGAITVTIVVANPVANRAYTYTLAVKQGGSVQTVSLTGLYGTLKWLSPVPTQVANKDTLYTIVMDYDGVNWISYVSAAVQQ